jgi:hypothetical protein
VADSTIKQRIDGVSKKKVKNKVKLDQLYEDNCWICNQWQEHVFDWVAGESNEEANFGAVYIHFDFEDYKGQFIGDITEDNLSLTRVLPM